MEGPLVERVERIMDLLAEVKPQVGQVDAYNALEEAWSICVGIRKDLYTMEQNINNLENLAQQVFQTAENTEDRFRRLLERLGGKKP